MLIGLLAEVDRSETRVAATPETVKKFIGLGADFIVEHGAGLKAGVTDADYQAAGARLADGSQVLAEADVLLKVRRPTDGELSKIKSGALVVASMDPYGHNDAIEAMARPPTSPPTPPTLYMMPSASGPTCSCILARTGRNGM